ncbi:MAG: hypothetical protein HP491_06380 [Nitrospira sp.]|nr:hypothetical protein [Nitrospira sp.]MBH0182369.1 hypothetical protein [Nitrospira sp.]MBH0186535.1 hypothetical protein [Nitrospira sp.]
MLRLLDTDIGRSGQYLSRNATDSLTVQEEWAKQDGSLEEKLVDSQRCRPSPESGGLPLLIMEFAPLLFPLLDAVDFEADFTRRLRRLTKPV